VIGVWKVGGYFKEGGERLIILVMGGGEMDEWGCKEEKGEGGSRDKRRRRLG
jgi:hypothetical protein